MPYTQIISVLADEADVACKLIVQINMTRHILWRLMSSDKIRYGLTSSVLGGKNSKE